MAYSVSLLVHDLERLEAMPLGNDQELQAWYVAAQTVSDSLRSSPELRVPEFVWHYLSDADLRLKDPSYGAAQRERLESTLRVLRKTGGGAT